MFIDIDIQLLLILILFGFLAAFIDSVVGGGGLIGLPALLFAGLSPAAAVATNKLAGTMGSLTSVITFYRSGNLDISSVKKLFPIVFVGSLLGAYAVHLMDPTVMKPLMLIMLVIVLIYTLLKKDWGTISTYEKLTKKRYAIFCIVVFFIGAYDGFLGPGTGSFFIFAFLMIGYDFLKAATSARFLNFGSNIAALLLFASFGQINYVYGLAMGIAQVFGAIVGTKFAIKHGSGYVRILFIIVTIALLSKNTYDYFH